jgi:methionyl-tRNA formyltransferase
VLSIDVTNNKTELRPRSIITDNKTKLEIVTGDGSVIINKLQAPGGKPMNAVDYMRGNKIM